MGATSWRYYAVYHQDPKVALQRLRNEVFARGDYVDLTGSMEDALRNTYKRFGRDPDEAESRRDIAQSLQLRRAVESGRKEDLTGLSSEDRAFAKRMRWVMRIARWFGAAPPAPRRRGKPRSIDELLERAEDSGTHSVLDITQIASRRRMGAAAPLPSRTFQKIFGTEQPTHEQVEACWGDIA